MILVNFQREFPNSEHRLIQARLFLIGIKGDVAMMR